MVPSGSAQLLRRGTAATSATVAAHLQGVEPDVVEAWFAGTSWPARRDTVKLCRALGTSTEAWTAAETRRAALAAALYVAAATNPAVQRLDLDAEELVQWADGECGLSAAGFKRLAAAAGCDPLTALHAATGAGESALMEDAWHSRASNAAEVINLAGITLCYLTPEDLPATAAPCDAPGPLRTSAPESGTAASSDRPSPRPTVTFDQWCTRLSAFVESRGGLPNRRLGDPCCDIELGGWVIHVRNTRDQLRGDRIRQMEAIPGWTWEDPTSNQAVSRRRFDAFLLAVGAHGTSLLTGDVPGCDFDVHVWLRGIRDSYRRGELAAETVRRFEALRDWTWDHPAAVTELAFRRAVRLWPGSGADAEDQVWLRRWIDQIREQHHTGTLAPDLAERAERLPGWSWTSPAEAAQQQLLDAIRYLLDSGQLPAAETTVARLRTLAAEPMDLAGLGHRLGISREAARQTEVKLTSRALHPLVLRRAAVWTDLQPHVPAQLPAAERQHLARLSWPLATASLDTLSSDLTLQHGGCDRAAVAAFARVARPAAAQPIADTLLCEIAGTEQAWPALRQAQIVWSSQVRRSTAAELPDDLDRAQLYDLDIAARCGLPRQPRTAGPWNALHLGEPGTVRAADALSVHVDQLGLSTRSRNALVRAGVATLGELCELTARDLLDIRHFGQGCLDEVEDALAARGLSLLGCPPMPPPTSTTSTMSSTPSFQLSLADTPPGFAGLLPFLQAGAVEAPVPKAEPVGQVATDPGAQPGRPALTWVEAARAVMAVGEAVHARELVQRIEAAGLRRLDSAATPDATLRRDLAQRATHGDFEQVAPATFRRLG